MREVDAILSLREAILNNPDEYLFFNEDYEPVDYSDLSDAYIIKHMDGNRVIICIDKLTQQRTIKFRTDKPKRKRKVCETCGGLFMNRTCHNRTYLHLAYAHVNDRLQRVSLKMD